MATLTEKVLRTSSAEVVRCFITGVFDGRGAIDFNRSTKSIRFIALDCDNATVVRTLLSVLKNFITNYNTARERLEGGIPRDNQLRIKNIISFIRL